MPQMLKNPLQEAIIRAYEDGYRLFITGMSRGFDLWAAQTVLELRQSLPIRLLCAVPFDGQASHWESGWQKCHQYVLLAADFVHSLSDSYTPDCFYVRNRRMVESSSRVICWFDGVPGGTAFTLRCAKRSGLDIDNLADGQQNIFWQNQQFRGVVPSRRERKSAGRADDCASWKPAR